MTTSYQTFDVDPNLDESPKAGYDLDKGRISGPDLVPKLNLGTSARAHREKRRSTVRRLYALCFTTTILGAAMASAQLTWEDIAALNAKAKALGWTFTVGESFATQVPLEQLCGLVVPDQWWEGARFNAFKQKVELPAAFDWRDYNGCTPVKDQQSCGSCWAFATVGAFECAIKVKDGQDVSLSEQWLISCNQETEAPHVLGGAWGCNGGWWAHDYHAGIKTDPCGGSGAVLTTNFPYYAADRPCDCPYPHGYTMDSWAYIGDPEGIPSVNAIKQAIAAYGPVSAGVYVDISFASYRNGVFNASNNQEINHGIVLVGWDDNQGANGVWILRNSWGGGWGEGGYMRIEYGCSNVGFGACYVDYAGKGEAPGPTILKQPADCVIPLGWQHVFSVNATGTGILHYQWEHNGEDTGLDSPALVVEHASYGDGGTYVCRVSDIRGVSVSRTAELAIDPLQGVSVSHPFALVILVVVCVLQTRRLLRRSQ